MHSSTVLSTLCLALFCTAPTLALTSGTAWVNFYKDCPSEILEVEEVTLIVSSLKHTTGDRAQEPHSSSPTPSIVASPIVSASTFASSSALPSASASSMKRSSKVPQFHSRRSQFRSALAARNFEMTTIQSPSINITQGECQAVPIATARHIDSSSVSVGAQLLTITPFQDCNITLHEVPGCIDEPLLVAPFKNREAQSTCAPRNFGAFNDVWVQLDCSEAGTGSMKPVRRVF